MVTVVTSIPDSLHPLQGEELHLEALVQADGSFMVTRVIRRDPPKASAPAKKMSLTQWANRWAGTLKLGEGETRNSLRDSALNEKFGK